MHFNFINVERDGVSGYSLRTCPVHADPQPLQDVLEPSVLGEVLQFEVDVDPQTRSHVGRGAGHPSQLLLPDERVFELPVVLLQLDTSNGQCYASTLRNWWSP